MGFYFRKSKKIGPFRLNFSNSGIGISTGVKGARISTNSKGTYINLGSNGLYYREKIGNGIPQLNYANLLGLNNKKNSKTPNSNLPLTQSNVSAVNTNQFIVSSSEQSIIDINKKINNVGITIKATIITFLLCCVLMMISSKMFFIWLVLGFVTIIAANVYDNSQKITQLFYELENDEQNKFNEMDTIFSDLSKAEKIWFVNVEQTQKSTSQNKYGLELIGRKVISLTKSVPVFIETNLEIWSIDIGNLSLYFFPERILLFNNHNYASIAYQELNIKYTEFCYLEEDELTKDGHIAGKIYKYINNDGSPNKRYANNPEIPLVSYGLLKFYSANGLKMNIMISNKKNAHDFVDRIKNLI